MNVDAAVADLRRGQQASDGEARGARRRTGYYSYQSGLASQAFSVSEMLKLRSSDGSSGQRPKSPN